MIVGGILPSLSPDYCKERFGEDCVYQGLVPQAEGYDADYSLLENRPDLQVLSSTRGCIRRCKFCYAWRLEGKIKLYSICKLVSWIHKNRVVFYDNNILAHPQIEEFLLRLSEVRFNGRVVNYECQSGFDGRILQKGSELVPLLKQARFRHPRIAWDGPFDDHDNIREQLDILTEGGYPSSSVQMFMLYNHDLSPAEIEQKRLKCWEWGVQVMDCRFRPLDQFKDDYNPYRSQTTDEYHIHTESGWTDRALKGMRKDFRRQNIQVRYNKFPFHSKYFERKNLRDRLPVGTLDALAAKKPDTVRGVLQDALYPEDCRFTGGIMPDQTIISDFC